MYSVRTHEDIRHNYKSNKFTQKKYDIERLRTNPSFFTKTLETQDSRINFEQTYQFSPHQIITSNTFDYREYDKLSLNSRVCPNKQINKQCITSLLVDIKLLTFISTQNQQSKQYISKKQKYLSRLRLQIEEKEEILKFQCIKYEKKLQQFNRRKYKIKKMKNKKLRLLEEEFAQLAHDIKTIRNKIKSRKLKTQPINNSNMLDKMTTSRAKQIQRVGYPTYYYKNMYQPQPYFYLQHPAKIASNQSYHHQFPNIQSAYQWQNKLNQSNFNNYNIQNKMKTQATYESKGNEQALSTSRKRSQFNGFQHSVDTNKNQKTSQIRNSRRSLIRMANSINMKSKNKQEILTQESKQKNILGDFGYFSSEYESENQGCFNPINNRKQTPNNKTTPVQILIKDESQCFADKISVQPQTDQWMELTGQSKIKTHKKQNPKAIVFDIIKVFDDKSQKNSSIGSNLSNVNVNVTIQSQEKNKQTVRSSSEQSKKRSVGQSIVAISMSGITSSKISKKSKANNTNEEQNQTKQTNRYMPHLFKQFMKIDEENEEVASLKTTPNQFGTPRNTSFNEKSLTPTNSQNINKIPTIQQEQQPFSPLKKPPALVPQKKDNQQLQYDGFLSKIKLNTQSKNVPKLTPITSKEDEDLLAAICLVGQSKISRLKSQSQRMSTSQNNNDFDELSSLKVNSQIKKGSLQKDSLIDDFDFILSGQSKITKKNKLTPDRSSLQYSPPTYAEQKGRFNRGSLGFDLQDNTIQQKQQEYDEYPSNKTNRMNKKRQ